MALNYDLLIHQPPRKGQQAYTKRDTMLYALGLGIGIRAVEDPAHLRFVYEEDLQALPTMATTLGHPGFWYAEPQYGIDWKKILHGDQTTEIHKPLPVEGNLRTETVVEEVWDKGAEKGALMQLARRLYDEKTGEHYATSRQGLFLRGNGGFGGKNGPPQTERAFPTRKADAVVDSPTRPEQALIYRLSGDYNPLHAAPKVATAAGFPKPIFHGLATYAIAGYAAIINLCGGDASRVRKYSARFSSPVFPGETLRTEIWNEGSGLGCLQVRVVERDLVVLKNGFIEYGG